MGDRGLHLDEKDISLKFNSLNNVKNAFRRFQKYPFESIKDQSQQHHTIKNCKDKILELNSLPKKAHNEETKKSQYFTLEYGEHKHKKLFKSFWHRVFLKDKSKSNATLNESGVNNMGILLDLDDAVALTKMSSIAELVES